MVVLDVLAWALLALTGLVPLVMLGRLVVEERAFGLALMVLAPLAAMGWLLWRAS